MSTPSSESRACGGKRKRIDDGVQVLNSKKRKETLFRKCDELTVKSDVDVGLVCIGTDGEIEAWPNHEKVKAMLTKHREKQAQKKSGDIKKDKYSHGSESEGKKLSAESLMTLLWEIDSKLEALDEKIKMLSIQKATDFCACENNSGSFMEVFDWHDLSTNTIESYGQPSASSAQLNQPTQFTGDSMVVFADKDYSFISSFGTQSRWVPLNTDNFALNPIWEPQIELPGAQDSALNGQHDIGALQNYYMGSDWNRLPRL